MKKGLCVMISAFLVCSCFAGIWGVSVSEAEEALKILSDHLPEGRVGEEYRYTLSANRNSGVTWEVNGLPEGLTLWDDEYNKGWINGTPEVAGSYEVKVTLKDESAHYEEITLPLDIGEASEEGAYEEVQNTRRIFSIIAADVPDNWEFGEEISDNYVWMEHFVIERNTSIGQDGTEASAEFIVVSNRGNSLKSIAEALYNSEEFSGDKSGLNEDVLHNGRYTFRVTEEEEDENANGEKIRSYDTTYTVYIDDRTTDSRIPEGYCCIQIYQASNEEEKYDDIWKSIEFRVSGTESGGVNNNSGSKKEDDNSDKGSPEKAQAVNKTIYNIKNNSLIGNVNASAAGCSTASYSLLLLGLMFALKSSRSKK